MISDIEISKEEYDALVGYLEEIDAITIGADSPDANELAKKNPKQALEDMTADMAAISEIVTKIMEMKMFY